MTNDTRQTPSELETDECEWQVGSDRCNQPVVAIVYDDVLDTHLHLCNEHLATENGTETGIEIVYMTSHADVTDTDPDPDPDQ